ncbi:MAG: hypothetical protein methR_P1434 [Methyloprofundus sp.]|nr:MAG: hypothetical protein methR_P1434 [Methyloprofundus sp.]
MSLLLRPYCFYITFLLSVFLVACDEQNTAEQHATSIEQQAQYANIEFAVINIVEQPYENKPALRINLSVPISKQTEFQSFLKVTDKQGQPIDGSWVLAANGKRLSFPSIEPNQDYRITVFKGLAAITQQQLLADVQQDIHTRDLQPFIDFASNGSLIPAELVKGLPVVSVNIDKVDVDFYRVKTDKLSRFLREWRGKLANTGTWQVGQYSEYADLAYSGRFNLQPPKNARYTTHLDIHAIDALQTPGVYLAVMRVAGQYRDYQLTYFTISDIGIHTHTLTEQLNVYVSSLASGKALAGVNLAFYDKKGKLIAELSSDKDGVAQLINNRKQAKVLVATQGKHLTVLTLKRAALDLSEFAILGRDFKPLELFTYGPRDIYRPGETVIINALLRDYKAESVSTPPLQAKIKRPDGQVLSSFAWHSDETGLYHYEFELPRHARTGQWALQVAVPGVSDFRYQFAVEDFLPERMALQLGNAEKSSWVLPQQPLNVPVSGRYLYGAPAVANRLSSQVSLSAKRHPLSQYAEFYFGNVDEKIPYADKAGFTPKDIQLDAQGLGTVAISAHWESVKHTPVNIALTASLYETGGRAINRFIHYTYWPQEALLGLRSVTDLEDIAANSQLEFELINIKSNAEKLAAEVTVTLIHEQRSYFWEQTEGRGWQRTYTETNVPVFHQQISLQNAQANILQVPVEQGQYLLRVRNNKTGQMTSLRFKAGNYWYAQAEQTARPDRVVLQWDKKAYLPGDIAHLKIIPPHAGNGFVLVENSQQALWMQRLAIPATGMNLDLPVDKSWHRHDIYATAVVFRAGDSKQKITPNRAVGIVHLPLDSSAAQLEIEIQTDTAKIRPETTLQTQLKLHNVKPGETAYVTLAAVDVGVLSITGFTTPQPLDWFTAQRRYSIDQHDVYGKIVEIIDGDMSKVRFGGDADLADDGTMPRTEVKVVALFTGPVQFDTEGQATVTLDIPDFNGKLRLMALAYSQDRFGATESSITVAAPIIAEAAMPRFLAGGDQSLLTLDILNQSGSEQQLNLNMSSTGPVKVQRQVQTLVLKDQQKQILRLPLSALQDFGQAELNLSLTNQQSAGEQIQLKRQWKIAVRPAYPAINKVIRKQIAAKSKVKVSLPTKQFLLNSSQATLTLANEPSLNIQQQLQALLRYPYGCLEQTTSSTYPWLFLNEQRIAQFKLTDIKHRNIKLDLSKRSVEVKRSIVRLAGMQRSNGSFGLWDSHGREEHWLTAYVSDFLLDAREQGFQVPDTVLNKALKRLTQYVNQTGRMYNDGYSPYPKHSSFAYKAYAGYVLSRLNRAPLGSLRTLYDHQREHSRSGLPLVHLGLALTQQGDTKRGQAAITQALTIERLPRLYLADYGSPLRDLSLMTYLLSKHKVVNVASEQLIFQLADKLGVRQYLSTQERNALFMTAIQLSTDAQSAWSAQLILTKVKQSLKQTERYQAVFKGKDIPSKVSVQSTYTQPLYLQLQLKGYLRKAPAKAMGIFTLQRDYYSLAGKAIDLAKLKVGELILVHVQVKSKERLTHALVVDLLPAGFELENQNLKNSIKLEGLPIKIDGDDLQDLLYATRVNYQEYRDDRYVAALDLHAGRANNLFYLARMVTPGTYTIPPVYIEDMYRPYIKGIGKQQPVAVIK